MGVSISELDPEVEQAFELFAGFGLLVMGAATTAFLVVRALYRAEAARRDHLKAARLKAEKLAEEEEEAAMLRCEAAHCRCRTILRILSLLRFPPCLHDSPASAHYNLPIYRLRERDAAR